jgi:hypothetical protein
MTSLAELPRYHAIVDTNVLVDLYTPRDLMRAYAAKLPEDLCIYRRARVREAMLFALYLHETRGTTWSLHHEPVEMLRTFAPPLPDEDEGETEGASEPDTRARHGGANVEIIRDSDDIFSSSFLTVFVWFVKEHLLSGWDDKSPAEPGALRSDDADLGLLWMAHDHGAVLVTNEGNATKKPKPDSLRVKGELVGVRVNTPREFVPSTFDADRAIASFFEAFRAEAPAYIAGRKDVAGWVGFLLRYYRHVLLGETEGR